MVRANLIIKLSVITLGVILLTGCGPTKQQIEFSETITADTASLMSQAATVTQIAQMQSATEEALSGTATSVAMTQTAQAEIGSELEQTATMQVDIVNTQTAFVQTATQQVIDRQATMEAQAQMRANPEISGQDPILDKILLQTDPSIGNDMYDWKGPKLTETSIPGVNAATRLVYFESSDDSSPYDYVKLMSTLDSSHFPPAFSQVINGVDTGAFTAVEMNGYKYYYNDAYQAVMYMTVDETCHILAYAKELIGHPDGWLLYMAALRDLIMVTDAPYCPPPEE